MSGRHIKRLSCNRSVDELAAMIGIWSEKHCQIPSRLTDGFRLTTDILPLPIERQFATNTLFFLNGL